MATIDSTYLVEPAERLRRCTTGFFFFFCQLLLDGYNIERGERNYAYRTLSERPFSNPTSSSQKPGRYFVAFSKNWLRAIENQYNIPSTNFDVLISNILETHSHRSFDLVDLDVRIFSDFDLLYGYMHTKGCTQVVHSCARKLAK